VSPARRDVKVVEAERHVERRVRPVAASPVSDDPLFSLTADALTSIKGHRAYSKMMEHLSYSSVSKTGSSMRGIAKGAVALSFSVLLAFGGVGPVAFAESGGF